MLQKGHSGQGIVKGYHCTVDLLFDWFGLVCFANKNKICQLSYSRFQTSQARSQQYSFTSPFSVPTQGIETKQAALLNVIKQGVLTSILRQLKKTEMGTKSMMLARVEGIQRLLLMSTF
jgi:hypothetical protein